MRYGGCEIYDARVLLDRELASLRGVVGLNDRELASPRDVVGLIAREVSELDAVTIHVPFGRLVFESVDYYLRQHFPLGWDVLRHCCESVDRFLRGCALIEWYFEPGP